MFRGNIGGEQLNNVLGATSVAIVKQCTACNIGVKQRSGGNIGGEQLNNVLGATLVAIVKQCTACIIGREHLNNVPDTASMANRQTMYRVQHQ
jgi:hypothetical protein